MPILLYYGAVFYDKLKDKYLTALWEVSGKGKYVEILSDEDELTKIDMYGGVTQIEGRHKAKKGGKKAKKRRKEKSTKEVNFSLRERSLSCF